MVDVIASALSAVLLGLTLLGLVVRFVLLPYLREQLRLSRETHKQVTENHHSNARPTVLDRIDDVHKEATRAADAADKAVEKVDTLGRMYDGHLEWSQNEVDRIWARLNEKRNQS